MVNGISSGSSWGNNSYSSPAVKSRREIQYYDVVKLQQPSSVKKPTTTTESTSSGDIAESKPYQTKKSGEALQKALEKLTSEARNSDVNKMIAKSSNTDAVAFSDTAQTYNANARPFSVSVEQIAKGQVNSSAAISETSKAVASSSTDNPYKFEIEVGGAKKEFSISVSASDDNKAIQTKMADAINSAKIGVSASIESKDGASKLSVASDKTGKENAQFTIRDTDNRASGLAAAMGITTKSQSAQNAVFRVGNADGSLIGAAQTSQSNTVDLGNGVSATLKKATTTPVKANFAKNTDAAVNATKEFVSALNDALKGAGGSSGKGSNRLASDIAGMNNSYSGSLSRYGINAKSDGTLEIDEKALKKAAESGKLQEMFQDDYGFANRATKIAGNMTSGSFYSNPTTYGPAGSSGASSYSAYKNYSSLFDSLG